MANKIVHKKSPQKKLSSSLIHEKNINNKFSFFKTLIPVLFFLFVAFFYFKNVTTDIYAGDIGDLVTAAFVGGVPHPSGYPLFTMLGYIFTHLPLPFPPVTKMAFISTIASFVGLILFYKLCMRFTKNVFIAIVSTSILTFSHLYWLHAEIPEVFGLNNFFAIVILYCTILFYQEKKIKYLYLLFFLCAISLTHHQTILFVFPGIFFLFITHITLIFSKKSHLLYLFLAGILGFLPYIYIPIAASHNPVINWDSAHNLTNFIRLLTRKDYGGFTTGIVNQVPLKVKLILTGDYFKTLLHTFSYQGIFLFLCGVIYLFLYNKRFFISFLFTFLFSGAFFTYYGANVVSSSAGIGVHERFYVLSHIFFVLFIPFGFLLLQKILSRFFTKPLYVYILLCYFIIIPLSMLWYNNVKTNLSNAHIGNNLALNILQSLPKNSILFVSGDTTTFNTWYVYYALGIRSDVDIINPAGVGGNNFLDDQINIYHSKNPKVPVKQIMDKTMEQLKETRRIFFTAQMKTETVDTVLLPRGLVFELVNIKDLPSKEEYRKQFEEAWQKIKIARRETLPIFEQNIIASEIPIIYSNALVRIGDFIDSHYKDPALSEHYYRRALWIDDSNPAGYAGLSLSLFKAYKDCKESINNMETAIDIYPVWKTYYLQRYILADKCNLSSSQKEKYKKEFAIQFNEDIEKTLQKELLYNKNK
jgi:hypothetical protein